MLVVHESFKLNSPIFLFHWNMFASSCDELFCCISLHHLHIPLQHKECLKTRQKMLPCMRWCYDPFQIIKLRTYSIDAKILTSFKAFYFSLSDNLLILTYRCNYNCILILWRNPCCHFYELHGTLNCKLRHLNTLHLATTDTYFLFNNKIFHGGLDQLWFIVI